MATVTELLTRREVADLMRVSVQTIDREIKRGHLRAVKVGKQVRISEGAVRDYVEQGGCLVNA